jgi:hypothetical protein
MGEAISCFYVDLFFYKANHLEIMLKPLFSKTTLLLVPRYSNIATAVDCLGPVHLNVIKPIDFFTRSKRIELT